MRLRLCIVGALLAVTLAGGAAAGHSAPIDKVCYWDPIAGMLVCDNDAPGGPPAGGGGGSASSPLGRWFVWINDIVPEPNACPVDPNTGEVPQRKYLQFIPTGNPTGVTSVDNWCPPRVVEMPPPPPTPEQLRDLAKAPEPSVNLSPNGRGVTGLPVYLWADAPAQLVVGPIPLRGWSVTGTAAPTRWEWTMGNMAGTSNPDPIRSSTRAGSAGDPAASYTYETKGAYTVQATVYYDGSFTVTGPYGVTVSAGIGSLAASSSRGYNVIEIRSARD